MSRSTLVGNASSALIAIAVALIAWFVFSDADAPLTNRDGFPEDAPIGVEVQGVPDGFATYDQTVRTVRLNLRGLESGLSSVAPGDVRAYVELHDVDTDAITVTLPIRIDCHGCRRKGVRVDDQDEVTTTIRIAPVVTETRPVSVLFEGEVPAQYRLAGSPTSPGQVALSGAQVAIDRVQRVVAMVARPAPEAQDEILLEAVSIAAVDEDGHTVPDVQLTPARVDVSLQLRGRGTQLSVRPVVTGAAADGFYVTSISVEPQLVQIEGPAGSTTDIVGEGTVEAVLDIDQATGDVVQLIPLDLPEGVTALNAPEGVTVTVRVSAMHGTVRLEVPVQTRDVGPGLEVAGISPRIVDVLVGGPQAQLGDLSADDVEVFVNLSGLGAGRHTLSPRPSVPSGYLWRSVSPSIVEVVLGEVDGPATQGAP